ncbi:hypothetical protein JTE90_015734 [Oedothorax gibbosus]|uniref:RNase H type-1 domain-containing protein n=1 Tax=Oedothorax gibbosus TaxID=931172 RepID=A0AAV6TYG2_9ARAC|nr:hypothetical protein JTE90_015734 [Oedothorax gibbosus]
MGTDRHENYTISLGFSRANRGAPDTARDAVLLREQRPSLRTSRFQGHELLQRKDNSRKDNSNPKSKLFIKHNPDKVMPQFCVPIRDLRVEIGNDDTPFARLVLEKITILEKFFNDYGKCPLSMGMRNVLVGEFLSPIVAQGLIMAKIPSVVDTLVSSNKHKIENEKLKVSLAEAQNKITELSNELIKVREAIRVYLENGVSLNKSVNEVNIAYDSKYKALEAEEKKRQEDFDAFCKIIEVGREKELGTAKEVLNNYGNALNRQNEVIDGVSGAIEEIKSLVIGSLDSFKKDMGNLRDTAESHVAQPIPSYAEMAANASDRSEVSMFVDLPKEGEGPLNFSSFKETLGVLIAKDNIRCNGIYPSKKGAKLSLPNLEDANKIKEILGNSPSFSNLKSSIASKENPKFIIKFTDYSEESALLEQLKLKNTIFKDVTVTTVFKIKAELAAINFAVGWAGENGHYVNIFTDSLSSIQALEGTGGRSSFLYNVKRNLIKYSSFFTLNWVKAHNNNWGNEIADRYAKIGAVMGKPMTVPIPYSRLKIEKSPLYLKYNSGTPMPDYCVPLRDMKALFKSDSSPAGKLIYEKMAALEDFFSVHEKCQLSVGMRNVLVGEFLVPILESHKKSQAKSPHTGKVDSMVELRKKDIELNKLKASCAAAQSQITVLEGELAKEREAIRRYMENGVS